MGLAADLRRLAGGGWGPHRGTMPAVDGGVPDVENGTTVVVNTLPDDYAFTIYYHKPKFYAPGDNVFWTDQRRRRFINWEKVTKWLILEKRPRHPFQKGRLAF